MLGARTPSPYGFAVAADRARRRREAGSRRWRRCGAALTVYGLVVYAVDLAGADVRCVLFGTRFGGERDVFLLLRLSVPWYAFAFPAGYRSSRNANHRFLRGAAAAGGLNLLLSVALIAPSGPIGDALATTVGSIGWSQRGGMPPWRVGPALSGWSWLVRHRSSRDRRLHGRRRRRALTLVVVVAVTVAVAALCAGAVAMRFASLAA